MFIRIASDLHLEAYHGRDPEILAVDFLPADERDQESVLVLAGDISSKPDQLIAFIRAVEGRFRKVIFVPGNHELYRHDLPDWNAEMMDRMNKYLTNTVFTDASSVGYYELDDARFIFGTLWADGGPQPFDQVMVSQALYDFRIISNGFDPVSGARKNFTVFDMIRVHKEQKEKIRECLEVPFDGKTVVITHHLPSRRLVSARFWPSDGSDGINGGFASNCDNIIAVHEPDLWINGHTHDRISTKLWNTRVECNPAGYKGEWGNSFSGGKGGMKIVDLQNPGESV